MNKFICALLVTLTSLMHADCLLNAINKHDLKKVTLLLKQKKYEPAAYALYINAANERIEKYRNDLQNSTLKIDPLFSAASAGCIIAGSFFPLYKMFTMIDLDCMVINNQNDVLITEIAKFIGFNALAGVFLGLAMALPGIKIVLAYADAMKIQQLILQLPH